MLSIISLILSFLTGYHVLEFGRHDNDDARKPVVMYLSTV